MYDHRQQIPFLLSMMKEKERSHPHVIYRQAVSPDPFMCIRCCDNALDQDQAVSLECSLPFFLL